MTVQVSNSSLRRSTTGSCSAKNRRRQRKISPCKKLQQKNRLRPGPCLVLYWLRWKIKNDFDHPPHGISTRSQHGSRPAQETRAIRQSVGFQNSRGAIAL